MSETPIKASLTSQGVWLVFARVVGFFFAFLLPLIIVRRFSQEAVGTYRQSFQLAGDAVTILSFGFNLSAFYYFNRDLDKRASSALNIVLFNFVLGAVAFVFLLIYPESLKDLFQNDSMLPLAPKIGLLIWFWLFGSFIEFAAVANQESRLGSLFIIGTQFTKALLLVGSVMFFETVEAIINAALIQCLLQSILLLVYLNSRFPRLWRFFDPKFFKEQAGYAIPYGLAGMLWIALTNIHFYFVGYRFSEAEFAIYAYGCFQLPLIAILAESAAAVILPRMSELELRGDHRGMTELISRAIEKLSFYYFAIYAYLIVVADVFITTLFTSEYASSVPIFVIFLTLLPFNIWLIDPVLRSFKSLGTTLLLLRVVFVSVLVVALSYAISSFTLEGIVSIVVLILVVDRAVCVWLAARRLGLTLRDVRLLTGVLKTAIVAVCAGVVAQFAFMLFKNYLPQVFATFDMSVFEPRIGEFIVGAAILGCTFLVFLPAYLLIANCLNVIDEKEKQILSKSWKLVVGQG